MQTYHAVLPLAAAVAVLAFAVPPRAKTVDVANLAPPSGVTSTGSGTAMFTVNADSSVAYTLTVNGLADVTGAHIHNGGRGDTGPVLVPLFGPENPVSNPHGQIVSGTFTAKDVHGIAFDALLQKMASGGVYVNVHSSAHPAGEIRGQIHEKGGSGM